MKQPSLLALFFALAIPFALWSGCATDGGGNDVSTEADAGSTIDSGAKLDSGKSDAGHTDAGGKADGGSVDAGAPDTGSTVVTADCDSTNKKYAAELLTLALSGMTPPSCNPGSCDPGDCCLSAGGAGGFCVPE